MFRIIRPICLALASTWALNSAAITLKQAERLAIDRDSMTSALLHEAEAASARSVYASQLQDPQVDVMVSNLPVDTLSFSQEPMTQFRVGVVQKIPRGKSLEIKRNRALSQKSILAAMVQDRRLQIVRDVRLEWFEIQYWRHAKEIVQLNRGEFEELLEIVESLYKVGRIDQTDVIRAQIELSQLDDRLIGINEEMATSRARLRRWLGADIGRIEPEPLEVWARLESDPSIKQLEHALLSHPKILLLDNKIMVEELSVSLAKQAYRPSWSLGIAYGVRSGSNVDGSSKSDFLTTSVSFSLPVFNKRRQDKQLQEKTLNKQAAIDHRLNSLYELQRDLHLLLARSERIQARKRLYQQTILGQSNQQFHASLNAYQSNRGDFADVMRASIARLETQLILQRINSHAAALTAQLKYLIAAPFNKEAIR